MSEQIHKIYQEDGTYIERPYTDEEIAQSLADQEETAKRKADYEAKLAARKALLEKLGITEEEAGLLFV